MEVEQTGVVGSTRGGSSDDLPSPLATAGPIGLADWRGDVALELWVETDVEPVRIRMAGRLDATTAANLDEVIRELLADGTRHIELSTDGLRGVDSSAVGASSGTTTLTGERAEGEGGPPARGLASWRCPTPDRSPATATPQGWSRPSACGTAQ